MAHFFLFPTPLGACGIAWCGEVIVATHLPEKTAAATAVRLAARTGASEGAPPPAIRCAMASMAALLRGARTDLTFVACDFSGIDPFETKVYAATCAIPAGETLTYGAIASQLGGSGSPKRSEGLSAAIPSRSSFHVIVSSARTTDSPAFRRMVASRPSSGCLRSRGRGSAERRGCSVSFRGR